MNKELEQARALLTVRPVPLKHRIDELIKTFMAIYGLGYYSPEGVDAPWATNDFNSEGRVTGEGQWRGLRRFAEEVRAL